jgi:hypothetical protein
VSSKLHCHPARFETQGLQMAERLTEAEVKRLVDEFLAKPRGPTQKESPAQRKRQQEREGEAQALTLRDLGLE